MATAQDFIKRAMRLVGALGSGETPTPDEITDGLTALNAMLDQWWLQRLAVHSIGEASYTWASAQQTQTIGTGGDFSATRPVRVTSAAHKIGSIEYPISLLTQEQYRSISDKETSTSLITHLYYDATFPLGTLYCYPLPSAAATVKLRTWSQIESFATATEVVSLPPGYEQAVVYNLAVILGPEYEREISPMVARIAITSFKTIKRANTELPTMVLEPAHLKQSPYFNWRTGD